MCDCELVAERADDATDRPTAAAAAARPSVRPPHALPLHSSPDVEIDPDMRARRVRSYTPCE